VEISALYEAFLRYPLAVTDSRAAVPGSLFFALKGARFDGNRFAAEALCKGSVMAVIDDPSYRKDERYVLVDNVLDSLQKLAVFHRKQMKARIIAVTGTNGKTTTKELIKACLSKRYHAAGTEGNLNNHIGVPLTLLRLKYNDETAVIEIGANHPQEITMLCNIADPDDGIITNIGRAHIEGFGSFREPKTLKEINVILARHGLWPFRETNERCPEYLACLQKNFSTEHHDQSTQSAISLLE